LLFSSSVVLAQQNILTASELPGFQVGADRQLADYRQIVSHFRMAEKSSDWVQIENLGPTLGNDLIISVIPSPENPKHQVRIAPSRQQQNASHARETTRSPPPFLLSCAPRSPASSDQRQPIGEEFPQPFHN
jgi:hypothetical protein